ncbi:hypothetical protein [Streptomyces sp. NPDC017940]|uniref:hypothetical protein n=1 Tax=Streptomyces sp. NPDC017940 TaxID=3365017 RepID=UPI0037A3AA54
MSQQDQDDGRKPRTTSRVTADLPLREYNLLDDARVLNAASTTDIMRAMVRLHDADPKFQKRVADEIAKMRREKLEARGAEGQTWRRRRGRTRNTDTKGLVA